MQYVPSGVLALSMRWPKLLSWAELLNCTVPFFSYVLLLLAQVTLIGCQGLSDEGWGYIDDLANCITW